MCRCFAGERSAGVNAYKYTKDSEVSGGNVQVYYDKDADLKYIKNKKIAVIGFGSQGHAHAMNLADSGCNVVVGLKSTSASVAKAQNAGLRVLSVRQAAEEADIIMILTPDELTPGIYDSDIAPVLKAGKYLALA